MLKHDASFKDNVASTGRHAGRPYDRAKRNMNSDDHISQGSKPTVDDTADSDTSDSEIVIRSRSTAQFNRADTVRRSWEFKNNSI
ncbi:unnamed protein product [Arctogadus glacialis]